MTDHDSTDDTVRDDQWNGSRTDSIIARIVDRQAEASDWDGLREIARDAPSAWEALLEALHLDAELHADVEAALAPVARVELPRAGGLPRASVLRLPRAGGWSRWTGWAAAAVLALSWYGSGATDASPMPIAGPVAGPVPPPAGASGLAPDLGSPAPGPRPRYPDAASSGVSLASDQVVSELPMQVVETRPAESGSGYDVYYVRRLLQRAHVGNVYSLGRDEHGQPAPVAVDPALLASADSL